MNINLIIPYFYFTLGNNTLEPFLQIPFIKIIENNKFSHNSKLQQTYKKVQTYQYFLTEQQRRYSTKRHK